MVIAFDIETLGLNAFQDQMVLIGMKIEDKIKQWKLWKEKDELSMILKCLKVFKKIPPFGTVVGYNNLKFDVPFIATRLSVLGRWSPDFWELLYRDRKWLDLYQFLGNDYRRLSYWLDRLGIKKKYGDIIGRDIPRFYAAKKYRKIVQHNKDDLETSYQLYIKLQEEFPELLRI